MFNNILVRSPESQIGIEIFHWALRPHMDADDHPMDVIYCLVNFSLKEDILRRAREMEQIWYGTTPIQLFQDFSSITLQERQAPADYPVGKRYSVSLEVPLLFVCHISWPDGSSACPLRSSEIL